MDDNTPRTLYCLVEGEDTVFKVTASLDKDIGDLKVLIHQRINVRKYAVVDTDLNLWALHEPVSIRPFETFLGRLPPQGARLSQHAAELKDPTAEMSVVFSTDPPKNHLSIIVDAGKARERDFVDKSAELLKTWSTPVITVPDILQLITHISMPLPENEKVPLSNYDYDQLLLVTWQTFSLCSNDDLQKLFRRSESEKAVNIIHALTPVLFRDPPEEGGTEASYITFWDDNIRYILSAIITQGQTKAIRDSNRDTSTLLQRPDFGLLTEGWCMFRGEEKPSSYSGLSPREELTKKLVWTYDPAPYVLGYYAEGTNVTLVAISPSLQLTVLAAFDLKYRRQRIEMTTYIIKLCSIIQALRHVVGTRSFSEFSPILRDSGAVIEVGSTVVRKTYPPRDRNIRVSHLQAIYDCLVRKSVPNVDQLALCKPSEGIVYLRPRGLSNYPRLVEDVQDAIICVLEALVVMHADPNPVFHRDIRWPNVIRHIHNSRKWFLIDWEDASILPTHAASHLENQAHSPQVSKDGHGAEVDVWAVGKLILDARFFAPPLSLDMIAVGKRMMDDAGMSAAQAVQEIDCIL